MSFNLEFFLVLATALTGAVMLVYRLLRKHGSLPHKRPWVVELSHSFFPVLLIVLLFRSFAFEPFRIPSGSMLPTLESGDFILVNKFSYGLRLPLVHRKFFDWGEPRRGDVVVFRFPQDPSQNFIKRLVGLPGDRIDYRDKKLAINGSPISSTVFANGAQQGPAGWKVLVENLTAANTRSCCTMACTRGTAIGKCRRGIILCLGTTATTAMIAAPGDLSRKNIWPGTQVGYGCTGIGIAADRFFTYRRAYFLKAVMSRKVREILGPKILAEPLMKRALTHRSAHGDHNERIEFLGDAVLGLLISDLLYRSCPTFDEGELTKLRSYLVSGASLAEVARAIDLTPMIRVGRGESGSGNPPREALLADTLEAVIGALYLLKGIEPTRAFIKEIFARRLKDHPSPRDLKDPKTRLQEYLQAQGYQRPVYELRETLENGDFLVLCRAESLNLEASSKAASKRKAEQQAAEQVLQQLQPR